MYDPWWVPSRGVCAKFCRYAAWPLESKLFHSEALGTMLPKVR